MPLIFRCTDIETLADWPAWTRGEPSYRLVADGRSPQEWLDHRNVGRVTYPAHVEETDPIPPPYACRVVAVSYVDVHFDAAFDPKYRYDRCYSECLWSPDMSEARADACERRLLANFNDAMMASEGINLVTWNGRGFDLPVLMMRSLKHRLACGWYYKNKDMRYRYSTEGHCDLMDYLSDHGAARFMKLGDLARLIGLPGKTDMSGDKVSAVYAESCEHPDRADELMAKTARYCLQDSLQTAILWLRTRHFIGKVSPEAHNATLATFRASTTVTDALAANWEGLLL